MSNFDHDELPPDLSDLGRRLRDERPRADADTVARIQARVLGSRSRTSRRTNRRSFAASASIFVAMLTVTAATASATIGSLPIIGGILPPITIPPISLPGITLPEITIVPPPPAPASGGATAPAATQPAAGQVASGVAALVAPIVSAGGLVHAPATTRSSDTSHAATSRVAPAVAAKLNANAGNHQYTKPGLICRIIRLVVSHRIARLLGC